LRRYRGGALMTEEVDEQAVDVADTEATNIF